MGTWDTISKLEDRAEEVLKGKELSFFEDGARGRSGNSTGCFNKAIEKVIAQTKRFLDSRENDSNNLKPFVHQSTVTAMKKTTYNPEHFERLKGTNSCPRCDLQDANFQGANLEGAKIDGWDIRYAKESGAINVPEPVVIADIRRHSKTFGEWFGIKISGQENMSFMSQKDLPMVFKA